MKYEINAAALIHSVVEVVRRSYNDMAIEQCDFPLYRQLVHASLDKEILDKIDCGQEEFQLVIHWTHVCQGDCGHKLDDILFGPYKA